MSSGARACARRHHHSPAAITTTATITGPSASPPCESRVVVSGEL